MKKYFFLFLILIFIILGTIFYLLKQNNPEYRLNVLMTGNLIMFLLSAFTFYNVRKSIKERPQAFVRSVYGSTFLKLIVCIFSILIYALLNREHIHKPSLLMLFGIYAVYTGVEAVVLSKLVRGDK